MTYNVQLYKNSGFNTINRPASISVLQDATSIMTQAIFDWQDLDKSSIKISAEFDDICDVDYCRIDNKYYIVTSIKMTSAKTAELSLMMDPILTAGGIEELTAISGWCLRHHVGSDPLFGNVTPETFTPHKRIKMITPEKIGPDAEYYGNGTILGLVCSTVDLTDLKKIVDYYGMEGAETTQDVAVPKLPLVSKPTYIGIRFGGLKRYTLPLTGCYIHSFQGVVDPDTDVNRGICQVRSLGIESAIKNVYIIPSGYLTAANVDHNAQNQRKIDGLVSDVKTYTPSPAFNYVYGGYTPKNNKVFTLCNDYTVYSICSGDSRKFSAVDLYAGGKSPDFYVYADFGPDGKPFIQPTYFEGASTILFQESVKGAQWIDEPLSYSQASGAGFITRDFEYEKINQRWGVAGDVAGIIGGIAALDVGAVVGGIKNLFTNDADRELQKNQTQRYIFPPEASFTVDRAVQGFVGNGFYITRTQLDPDDMEAFDNYLTQFGYNDAVAFDMSFLTNRQCFNYIQTQGASVKCTAPLRVRNAIAALLDSGVRLWHELPNTAAMTNNPIAT